MNRIIEKSVLLLFVMLFAMIGFNAIREHSRSYTRNATVTAKSGSLYTVVDSEGFEWCLFADGLEVGQKVELKMNNQGTEDIFDDSIEKVTIKGWQ